MRLLSAIFGLIVLLFIVWFTVSNQQALTLSLSKISNILEFANLDLAGDSLTLPTYIWGFIIFAIGFLSGVVATIMAGGKARSQKRELKRNLKTTRKELTKREKEIMRIKENDDTDVDPIALIQKS